MMQIAETSVSPRDLDPILQNLANYRVLLNNITVASSKRCIRPQDYQKGLLTIIGDFSIIVSAKIGCSGVVAYDCW